MISEAPYLHGLPPRNIFHRPGLPLVALPPPNAITVMRFLASLRQVLRWTIAWYPLANFGEHTAYEQLTAILALVVVTAGTFAFAIETVSGSYYVATLFYCAINLIAIILTAIVMNSRSATGELQFNGHTAAFGRWVIGLTMLLMVPLASFASFGLFPGQQPRRHDFTSAIVPIGEPVIASDFVPSVNVRGAFRDEGDEDLKEMERMRTWFSPSVSNRKQETILVVQQYPAFDRDYNTFSAIILHRPTIEFKDALILIRRTPPAVGGGELRVRLFGWRWGDAQEIADYEQLRLPRTQSGKPFPVITVPKPNKGDRLLVLARFEATDGNPLHPDDPSWFQIQLRRIQR